MPVIRGHMRANWHVDYNHSSGEFFLWSLESWMGVGHKILVVLEQG